MVNRDDQGGQNNSDITEEVDSYYQNEDKSRSGSAILYGLFALVVTLIVAAGLFFGGRAVYRALTGSTSEDTTQQEGQNGSSSDSGSGNSGKSDENENNGNGSNQTPGVAGDNGFDESEDSPASGGGASDDMPSTGDNLPATGSPTGM